ncbi:MAG TPA: NAD(+) diphosphatase [Burkholderiaceae bacterium]
MHFTPAVTPFLPPSTEAWGFAFVEGRLLLHEGGALLPWPESLPAARHYIGRLGGLDCWAFRADSAPPDWQAQALRPAMMGLPEPLMLLAGRAAQVLEWERCHAFCGVCGTPTKAMSSERARRCPACNHTAYPRINPAMMALVWRGQELLLARSPNSSTGFYSALAGFVEAGESLEDCVKREVMEEVGVTVDSLTYFGSQSWPFPHSLMVAYTAEWIGGEIVPQAGEIEEARWFHIDELPPIPPRFSISGHLIRDTADRLKSRT